jgi:hypothetical protein
MWSLQIAFLARKHRAGLAPSPPSADTMQRQAYAP